MAETQILIALYPGVTHLDFTGPHQVLCRVPEVRMTVASLGGADIEADGLRFAGLARLEDVSRCDVLLLPGGFGCTAAMNDAAFMGEIRRLGADASYLASVCTGSLILGAAGFLMDRRAACHWAWRHLLPLFGAIPDEGRVVRDGNILTGGGVTAGIDFALTLAAELAGPEVAQTIQLSLEYAPAPPFNSGRPETAPAEVLRALEASYLPRIASRREEAEKAARTLGEGR
ncbi:MAG TPA: DJ-1/PfpI family protein [Caulobacteraceae bacterium]|jgi:putative intracellular protease/amidase|nr:DJ-1/PfpI family protein [Caulobacteraceae bacterium]